MLRVVALSPLESVKVILRGPMLANKRVMVAMLDQRSVEVGVFKTQLDTCVFSLIGKDVMVFLHRVCKLLLEMHVLCSRQRLLLSSDRPCDFSVLWTISAFAVPRSLVVSVMATLHVHGLVLKKPGLPMQGSMFVRLVMLSIQLLFAVVQSMFVELAWLMHLSQREVVLLGVLHPVEAVLGVEW